MRVAAAFALAVVATVAGAQAPPVALEVRPLGGVAPQIAALLTRSGRGGGLAMEVATVPLAGGRLVVVEMDAGSLLAGHPGGRLGVEIALYAVASDGRIVEARHDGVAVNLGPGGTLPASGLRYLARLDSAGEAASLRVLARVHRTGAFALRTLALAVPAESAAGMPERTWLDAYAPGLTAEELAPLVAAGGLPTALAGQPGAPGAPGAPASPPSAAAVAERPQPLPSELEPTVAEYRAAWRLVAEGQEKAARDRLAAFETAAVTADRARAMGLLARAEAHLLEGVEKNFRPALLPLGLFYGELFRAHVAAGHPGLARRAALVAERALLRFGAYPAPAEDRQLAAAALDGLAAEYVRIEAPGRAASLLARAADLEPGRASRWLALAALAERDWALADAARAVDKALAVEPGNREGLLRRARIAAARGNRDRAAVLLDALLERPRPDWVGAVAAEERARLYFEEGRADLAVAPLERALLLAPDEASLAAALAFARERSGRRAAALDAASRAFDADRRLRVAPRRRYSEPPVPALLESGAAAESAALLRLDVLAAALAEGGARR